MIKRLIAALFAAVLYHKHASPGKWVDATPGRNDGFWPFDSQLIDSCTKRAVQWTEELYRLLGR